MIKLSDFQFSCGNKIMITLYNSLGAYSISFLLARKLREFFKLTLIHLATYSNTKAL